METPENPQETSPSRPASALLEVHGAFAADGADAGVAAHYGDPLAEQRILEADREAVDGDIAVVDRSNLGLVRVSGPDRASWLTSLASQVLTGMQAGDSVEFLLLSPQGRIEYAPLGIEDGESLWLIVEPEQAAPLTEYLNRMKFMMWVEISDLSDSYAAVETARDPRRAHPVFNDAPIWEDPWRTPVPGGYNYTEVEQDHPGVHYRRYVSIINRSRLGELARGTRLAGVWAAEALRIAAWRPRAGTEVDNKSIPQELDYTRTAVHFDKGCYKGQETVARVHNLGHPPRRLVFLDIDGSEHTLPAQGAEIFAAGKPRPVGRITSVALHYEAGPIALAVIKRATAVDAPLRVVSPGASGQGEEYVAAQTTVVSPEAGEIARKTSAGQTFLARGNRS